MLIECTPRFLLGAFGAQRSSVPVFVMGSHLTAAVSLRYSLPSRGVVLRQRIRSFSIFSTLGSRSPDLFLSFRLTSVVERNTSWFK